MKTKILCLGTNDPVTDYQVNQLAELNHSINHGLITDSEFVPELPGYYHTTVVDIPWGCLIEVARHFDSIIMLDQPQSQWTHWKCLQSTYKFMVELESRGMPTIFRDNNNVKKFNYWLDLLKNKNKSICIYPWVNMHNNNQELKVCSRSTIEVTTLEKIISWHDDPDYQKIREKMIAGESLPEHCGECYEYEKLGIESYRQFETFDWISELDISSVDDLQNIKEPYFYEVHGGNTCNIKCRGCDPLQSSSIEYEFKKFNISTLRPLVSKVSPMLTKQINVDHLTSQKTVYFHGGEPTLMSEVSDFLKTCVEKNKTDFNLTMCTNGTKLLPRFTDLIKHFSNVSFSFSIDGFGPINDYWRSGSHWEQVISNAHYLESLGYKININTVPGIYNVTNLHLLFEFLDKEFPFTTVYLQFNYYPEQSAFNHPNTSLVIESLERCMNTSIYHSNGKSCKSGIDSLYQYYSKNPKFNRENLCDFFKYNDRLDQVRGVKLGDYIPELEDCRKYI